MRLCPRTLVMSALRHVGADGVLLFGATCALVLVIARLGGRLEVAGASLVAPTQTFVPVILFCAWLRRRDGAIRALARSLRAWSPLFVLYVLCRNLRAATGFLGGRSVERTLLALDQHLFGLEPSAWIQKFASPVLSDYMAFAYALMFLMPFLVMCLLYARGRRHDFREVGNALLLCTYAGFLLYIAFPARSPRWAFPEIYGGVTLHGAVGVYEATTRAWDHVELMLYDAFPSLHTAVSTLSLAYAWRMGPILWPRRPRMVALLLAPFVVSLQIST